MAWKCDVSQENEIQSCAKEIFTVFGNLPIFFKDPYHY